MLKINFNWEKSLYVNLAPMLVSELFKSQMPVDMFHTANRKQSVKTGIVMLNMGGPQSIDGVSDYLHRIMTDTDMIQLPFQRYLIIGLLLTWVLFGVFYMFSFVFLVSLDHISLENVRLTYRKSTRKSEEVPQF